jgi:small-conductance mechanosensitive channel
MTNSDQAKAEQLKAQQPAIREALRQTAPSETPPPPQAKRADRLWFGTYFVILVGLAVALVGLNSRWSPLPLRYVLLGQRLALGSAAVVLVLAAAKAVEVYWIGRLENVASRYNLQRVARLVVVLALVIIALTVLSRAWYTAVVSLGLISLVLGFALQTPITSFIGWIYLLIRQPYKVGDRVKIGDATGDVIDVSYLDTTLWEFGGPYLSTEHPSGRIVKFPNSLVLNETVYNYSWPLFPYVWNEIKFQIAYNSDLEFVAETMRSVVEADLGSEMEARVKVYCELLAKTPVDALEIQGRPVVHFRSDDYAWIEAIVRYVVPPKEAGRVKTRLIRKLLAALNAEPERVAFPKGASR